MEEVNKGVSHDLKVAKICQIRDQINRHGQAGSDVCDVRWTDIDDVASVIKTTCLIITNLEPIRVCP